MNKLQTFISSKPCGFLTEKDMPELIKLDRLCPVLVRCGGCRFTCAAQDAAHIMTAIEKAGDYVRDVSFPVGSHERAEHWQPDCVNTPIQMVPQSFTVPRVKPSANLDNEHFNEADCGGVFDGFSVTSDADPGL